MDEKANAIAEIQGIIDDWTEVRISDDECLEEIQEKIRPYTIDQSVGRPQLKYEGTIKAKVVYGGRLPIREIE